MSTSGELDQLIYSFHAENQREADRQKTYMERLLRVVAVIKERFDYVNAQLLKSKGEVTVDGQLAYRFIRLRWTHKGITYSLYFSSNPSDMYVPKNMQIRLKASVMIEPFGSIGKDDVELGKKMNAVFVGAFRRKANLKEATAHALAVAVRQLMAKDAFPR